MHNKPKFNSIWLDLSLAIPVHVACLCFLAFAFLVSISSLSRSFIHSFIYSHLKSSSLVLYAFRIISAMYIVRTHGMCWWEWNRIVYWTTTNHRRVKWMKNRLNICVYKCECSVRIPIALSVGSERSVYMNVGAIVLSYTCTSTHNALNFSKYQMLTWNCIHKSRSYIWIEHCTSRKMGLKTLLYTKHHICASVMRCVQQNILDDFWYAMLTDTALVLQKLDRTCLFAGKRESWRSKNYKHIHNMTKQRCLA